MSFALVASALFLTGYLTRVTLGGTHRFPDLGWIRSAYLILLAVHTVMAALNLPLVIAGLWFAWRGTFDRHRKVMRSAWPVWIFVSGSGVLVYLMLYQIFV